MIHYSCDLCGRNIGNERYTAKVEIAAAFDADEITEDDLTADHLEQIADEIQMMESTDEFQLEETGPKKFEFDLCSTCMRKYARSPLNANPPLRTSYSQN